MGNNNNKNDTIWVVIAAMGIVVILFCAAIYIGNQIGKNSNPNMEELLTDCNTKLDNMETDLKDINDRISSLEKDLEKLEELINSKTNEKEPDSNADTDTPTNNP